MRRTQPKCECGSYTSHPEQAYLHPGDRKVHGAVQCKEFPENKKWRKGERVRLKDDDFEFDGVFVFNKVRVR